LVYYRISFSAVSPPSRGRLSHTALQDTSKRYGDSIGTFLFFCFSLILMIPPPLYHAERYRREEAAMSMALRQAGLRCGAVPLKKKNTIKKRKECCAYRTVFSTVRVGDEGDFPPPSCPFFFDIFIESSFFFLFLFTCLS
jgi:hypothetical protein